MTRTQRFGYWLAVGLIVSFTLYSGFWLVLDIGARLNLIPGLIFGIDARGFTFALSLWNEILFAIVVTASILATVLILRRSHWVVWAFGCRLAASIADWISLTGNEFYDGSGFGFVPTTLGLMTLGLLIALRSQRVLR